MQPPGAQPAGQGRGLKLTHSSRAVFKHQATVPLMTGHVLCHRIGAEDGMVAPERLLCGNPLEMSGDAVWVPGEQDGPPAPSLPAAPLRTSPRLVWDAPVGSASFCGP